MFMCIVAKRPNLELKIKLLQLPQALHLLFALTVFMYFLIMFMCIVAKPPNLELKIKLLHLPHSLHLLYIFTVTVYVYFPGNKKGGSITIPLTSCLNQLYD